MNFKKNIRPLPFSTYYLQILLAMLTGFGISIYLSISHYRVYTDLQYSSFCAISKAINCDTVSQSPYSIYLGIPVPIWGVLGYLVFIIICIFATLPSFRPKRLWRLLFVIAVLFSIISIFLAIISSFLIRSYCIMCLVTYSVNFALAFYTYLVSKRFDPQSFFKGFAEDLNAIYVNKRIFGSIALALMVASLLLWNFLPTYWKLFPDNKDTEILKGFTEDGHPWIGAKYPALTIVEYADYQCFQCKKMHFHLRKLISKHSDRIRLVHRHYPMDHTVNPVLKNPFHEGSAVFSLLAIQAGFKGKFWEANDELYLMAGKGGPINTADLSNKLGLMPKDLAGALKDAAPYGKLLGDIRDGMKIGITGTPTYVINGVVYEGVIPAKIISDYITNITEGKVPKDG